MKEKEPVMERVFLKIDNKEMEDKIWKFKRCIYTDFNARTEYNPKIYGADKTNVIQIQDENFHIIGQLLSTDNSFTIKGEKFTELWEEMFDDKDESDATSSNEDIDLIKDIIGAKFVKK